MGKSLKLGTLAGIRVQVHWTFLLLIVWVWLSALMAGKGLAASLSSVAFVLALFGCVLLHELGHALAARMYSIPTRDITLLPIGGVARLERMPRKPIQELVVALAGPAVNVVIAALLFALLAPVVGIANLTSTSFEGGRFLQQLMFVNLALVAFNLLPAFPMDGGRVVRAFLAMFLDYGKATRIAALLGQLCAIGLGFLAVYNPMLLLISAFVFFGAAAEAKQVMVRERMKGFQVSDGMRRRFRAVSAHGLIRESVVELLESQQDQFPVIQDGLFVGMVRLESALATLERQPSATFSDVMRTDVIPVDASESLVSTMERASAAQASSLPVVSDGLLVGLLDFRNALELVNARNQLRSGLNDQKEESREMIRASSSIV